MIEFRSHLFPYNYKAKEKEEILMKKRTLRRLEITLYKPKKVKMRYLISTTGSLNKLPDETAKIFGFGSFEEFAQYMWPFDAPVYIYRYYSVNMFCADRDGERMAMLTYSGGIAETPINRYCIETPILIQITNPKLIPSVTSLISSKPAQPSLFHTSSCVAVL